jgi:multidrug efflux pump subunit AcrB
LLYIFNHFILTPKVIIPFQERLLPALKNNYKKLITWLIKGWRPVYAVISMVVLLVFTGYMMSVVKPEVIFFPSAEPDYIYVYNVMPIGTDAVKTDQVTREIERRVFEVIKENKAEGAINSVISNVGKNAGDPMLPDRSATPHKSKVTVAFVSKSDRNGLSSQELLNKVRSKLEGIPGTEISVQRENNGPPTGKAVSIEIVGKEFDEMMHIEKLIRAKIAAAGIKGIEELNNGKDSTLEVADDILKAVLKTENDAHNGLFNSRNILDIADCNYYIVTVPTPVDKNNRPDLTPLYKASETVGKVLKKGDIVIYESTVYP